MEEIRIPSLYPFCLLYLRLSISLPPNLVTYTISVPFSSFHVSRNPILSRRSLAYLQLSFQPNVPVSSSPSVSDVQEPVRLSSAAVYWEHEASKPFGDGFFKSETTQTSTQRSWNSNLSFKTRIRLQTAFLLSSCCMRACLKCRPNRFSSSSSSLISQSFPGMMSLRHNAARRQSSERASLHGVDSS